MEPKLESKCSFGVVNLCFSFSPPVSHIQEHHQYRDNIYTIDGVILYKDSIVIPLSFRENILNILHSAQLTKVLVPCFYKQCLQFSGLALQQQSKPMGIFALTATGMCLHDSMHHLTPSRHQNSVFIASVQAFSAIKIASQMNLLLMVNQCSQLVLLPISCRIEVSTIVSHCFSILKL